MDLKEYKDILSTFIKFRSISTDSWYTQEVIKAANWLEELFGGYGFIARLLHGETTNPYVFAEYKVADDAKTVLIYGHYDVQPASMEDGWTQEPFELCEKDDKLYGRGAVDNKGQLLVHVYTIGNLIKEKKLKYNVKFFVEGNEETGNTEIRDVITKHRELFDCDYILLSDGEITVDRPTLDVAFRGGANVTLEYKTAKTNLHSGIYGGAIPNASHELSTLISRFYDSTNKVTFSEFYEGVDAISEKELEGTNALHFDMNELRETTGIKALKLEKGFDFYSQTGLRPMLTVTGFKSGYIEEGYSNIVPSSAEARINFRFVTSQNPKKVLDAFENFVKDNTPDYVEFTLEKDSSWPAIRMNTSTEKFKEVVKLLEKTYGDEVVFKYVGGSIPVISDFKDVLGKDVISVSMANEDCNMHGIDENFDISLVKKGLSFSNAFFSS